MKTWIKFVVVYLAFTIDIKVNAEPRQDYFKGVRQAGMGGASIGVVNDETSLLSNPNGLGKLRNSIFTLIDPEFSFSSGMITHIAKLKNPLDYFDLQDSFDLIDGRPDRHIHSKVQFFPSIVMPNFGLGLFKKYSYDLTSSNDGTEVSYKYYDDTALLLGYNFRFWGGRIQLGFVGKYLDRGYSEDIVPTGTSGLDVKDNMVGGSAIGIDVGLNLSAPWVMLPSLSLVARDVGNTKFSQGKSFFHSSTDRPNAIKQTIDAAVSIFPMHTNYSRSSFTIELKDIEDVLAEKEIMRRTHIGWEINSYDALFFRLGMNQRFWTAGLELATTRMQFQIASYGEDVGSGGKFLEDRRYVTKFSYRF